MRLLAPVMLALLAAACGDAPERLAAPADVSIAEGRPFPHLVLPALADGRPAAVAQFQGKKTLLHVFASW